MLRRAGARDVTLEPAAGHLVRMRGTATVLGQTVPVAAVGRVRAAGRSLRIVPKGFEVDGTALDSAALLDALGARFTLVYRLTGLPAGIRVWSVTATTGGFRVVVTGHDVRVPTGS